MPDTAPPPDLSASLPGWIARLNHLRDDVTFGLDSRGIAATLADVLDDMQQARKRDTP